MNSCVLSKSQNSHKPSLLFVLKLLDAHCRDFFALVESFNLLEFSLKAMEVEALKLSFGL